ncbi:hypothetical protein [Mesorhizobium sp.]|uniref:hypothetical protein n=1 Tax=Mesorhizobium sp. TaxID=1871066 RepID=UPI000FE3F5AD|nr:hypothetical protein [Mesorhizobium sp.]RWH73443.1 MAG: hypothetical protein EOQ84_07470 [Mesorhizobium sp.]RWL25662.1 MAG: hypothetical protein EOR58_19690 [Mesorhizobium sp.]RWL36509.1 MAG: hypothetical protein EOR63_00745 [Mesorhizobium sp.]RWL40731.1 MAG: hypothetical protein EOR59_04540 [Mesorhizobium sp.]RWL54440.1 MAG: hypothetical protein EOR62_11825 [Mesorhizobium sp.]
MAKRYALRMDKPNSCTVIDVFTGQHAEFEKKMMIGIKTRRAEKIAGELNLQDAKRREEAGWES